MVFDQHLVVPDADKSLEKGAVLPWRRGNKRLMVYYKGLLRGMAQHYGQSQETPWKDLPEDFKEKLMHGSGEEEIEFNFWRAGKVSKRKSRLRASFPISNVFTPESESEFTKNRLKSFMNPQPCDACGGRRLKPEILAVTLGGAEASQRFKGKNHIPPGLSIMEVCGMSIDTGGRLFRNLKLTDFQQKISAEVIKEIRARLGFLKNVGLGYLTLNDGAGRQAPALRSTPGAERHPHRESSERDLVDLRLCEPRLAGPARQVRRAIFAPH